MWQIRIRIFILNYNQRLWQNVGSAKPGTGTDSDSIHIGGCQEAELPVPPDWAETGEVAAIKADKGYGFIRYSLNHCWRGTDFVPYRWYRYRMCSKMKDQGTAMDIN